MKIAYTLISYNIWKKGLTRAEITKTLLKSELNNVANTSQKKGKSFNNPK